MNRCERIGPVSGLRCVLKKGHTGDHWNDLRAVRKLAKQLTGKMFPVAYAKKVRKK